MFRTHPPVERLEGENCGNDVFTSVFTLNNHPVTRKSGLRSKAQFAEIPIFSGSSNKMAKTPRLSLGPLNEPNCEVIKYRMKSSSPQIAPFSKYGVPDLVVLHILGILSRKDLCNMMRTCRRFYILGNKVSSWKSIDLAEKRISEFALISLMKRNIQVMRLSDAKADPVCQAPFSLFNSALELKSRMHFLDTSRAALDIRKLSILLKPCKELLCLSLEGQTLDDSICQYIAQNENLRRLDLSMTTGLTYRGAYYISRNCKKLVELNISWCGIDGHLARLFCELLTPDLKKLNISGTIRNAGLTNGDIENLVKVCPKLEDLDISDNVNLSNDAIICIATNLRKLTTLSCNRCYGFDPNIYCKFNETQLRFLNVHGCIMEESIEQFKLHCDKLEINRQIFNYTAKPNNSPSLSNRIWDRKLSQ